ncbi:MAG: DNA polymerase III subunit gamma/tau [Acidobacteria bacterium]|nr:DNA polymerase III subunit gamma/tau [Acidobacteriota bacterium]MDW7984957.1 DNA polymerase III subunit gamma/tau [Acidobacteriota bacterium]
MASVPTFTSLALRWRPQSFDQVIGQRHVVQTLKHAVEKGRVAQCYLFSGPRGAGKTSLARILAKSLNCERGPTVQPCQACVVCVEIAQGRSPDVLEIDGASNRGINEIRNLQEILRYRPLRGRYKVVIIDEVHMLTQEAFNALLKTLEEPPPHVVFVLATTEFRKVPLTIVSRCQQMEFHRINEDDIYRRLIFICDTEGIEAEAEALRLLARAADGSLRDAISLLDQAHTYAEGPITAAAVAEILGLAEPGKVLRLARWLAFGQTGEALTYFHELIREGYDLKNIIDDLLTFFRTLLWARFKTDEPVAVARDRDTQTLIDELLPVLREEDVLRICQQLLECAERLRYSELPLLQAEMTLARICQLPRLVELEKLLDTWVQGRPWQWNPEAPAVPVQPPTGEAEAAAASLPLTHPKVGPLPLTSAAPSPTTAHTVGDFIEWLRSQKEFALLFTHVQDWQVDETAGCIYLATSPAWKTVAEMTWAERMTALRQAMHDRLGRVYRIEFKPTRPETTEAPPPDARAEARRAVESDPDVQRYLQVLGGEVVKVEDG